MTLSTPRDALPGAIPASIDIGRRVLALDLDGTIVGEDLKLPPFTARVLRAVRAGGTEVVLATGRMFRSALPYAQALGLTGPMVNYQGAMITDIGSRRVLLHRPLPLPLAREILQPLEAAGHTVNVYVDDRLYLRELTPASERYRLISRVEVNVVGGPLTEFLQTPTTKIVVTGDPPVLDELAAGLRARYDGRLYVQKSLPFFLEIAHPDVSKSRALAYLGRRHGFAPEDVLAFGDGHNDVDLLTWAGRGVAMGNAGPEVQAAADTVCPPVWEQGVARYLLAQAGC